MMTNAYVLGADALASAGAPEVPLTGEEGLTCGQGLQLALLGIAAAGEDSEIGRQLANMATTCARGSGELPVEAAGILCATVREALAASTKLPVGGDIGTHAPDYGTHKPDFGVEENITDALGLFGTEEPEWGTETPDLGTAEDILGAYDITAAQRQMNTLKAVTVNVAQALLSGGMKAIDEAITLADQYGLPGPTARKNVKDHLQWHADALAKLAATPMAPYPPGSDLQKYVMMAFVEGNATQEGVARLDVYWRQMWVDIGNAIAALPAQVRQIVYDTASGVVQATTGLPLWAWGLIAVGTAGALGFAAWKMVNSPVGVAVASTATRSYLRR